MKKPSKHDLTPQQLIAVEAFLGRFSTLKFNSVKQLLTFKEAITNGIQQRVTALEEEKVKKSRATAGDKAAREAFKANVCEMWGKVSLNVGDIVKFKNTRDNGLRRVLRIEGDDVVCVQGSVKITVGGAITFIDKNQMTTNSLSKLWKILRNNEWVDIYTLASGNIKDQ